jgi:hypothetical protein
MDEVYKYHIELWAIDQFSGLDPVDGFWIFGAINWDNSILYMECIALHGLYVAMMIICSDHHGDGAGAGDGDSLVYDNYRSSV